MDVLFIMHLFFSLSGPIRIKVIMTENKFFFQFNLMIWWENVIMFGSRYVKWEGWEAEWKLLWKMKVHTMPKRKLMNILANPWGYLLPIDIYSYPKTNFRITSFRKIFQG